jgi:hypothetical protein
MVLGAEIIAAEALPWARPFMAGAMLRIVQQGMRCLGRFVGIHV